MLVPQPRGGLSPYCSWPLPSSILGAGLPVRPAGQSSGEKTKNWGELPGCNIRFANPSRLMQVLVNLSAYRSEWEGRAC